MLGLAVGLGGGPAQAAESSRAAYEAGKQAGDKGARERCFAEGMSLAKARLAAKPDDPEGLYWLAVNMGAHALERGKLGHHSGCSRPLANSTTRSWRFPTR